jgi:hypothetical protein
MNERRLLTFLLAGLLTFLISAPAGSMTFQFDRSKPGVTEFVESYIRFSIRGKQLAGLLPPLFYVVTESSERETVVVAKVANANKNEKLSSAVSEMLGQDPNKVKGPHGKMIFYNPIPESIKLGAYTEWKDWIFIAGNPDALVKFLKGATSPQALVTPHGAFLSDGLPKSAAVRFWADNANGNLTALLKENQQRSMIPLPKDPESLRRFSGTFRLESGRKIVAVATAVPAKPQQRSALKKDLELTIDTSRRLLEIFKVPSVGVVKEKGKVLDLQLSIDDYLLGQPGLFKGGGAPPLKGSPDPVGSARKS